jgi:DnaK suppressor protein
MQLVTIKQNVEKEIADLRIFMSETKANCADDADNATVIEQISLARAQLQRKAEYTKQLQKAIQRQKDGEYGDCIACGDEIEQKRLAINPAAECCAECEQLRYLRAKSLSGNARH